MRHSDVFADSFKIANKLRGLQSDYPEIRYWLGEAATHIEGSYVALIATERLLENHRGCRKCGADNPSVRWHTSARGTGINKKPGCERDGCLNKCSGEHLHYTCSCGYEWTEQTKDNR